MSNNNLHKAKEAKNDEFYTQLTDIEKELYHYKDHFRDKVVFCNCDDPEYSNFWHFFSVRFDLYGLKKLISTHYEPTGKPSYMLSMERVGGEITTVVKQLTGDGDFRSPECVALLEEADIVVTNPPFSLFREYIAQLIEHEKKFLIIGNMNAITYKEVFPLIKENQVWFGHKCFGGGMNMIFPEESFDATKVKKYTIDENGKIIVNIMGVIWYTNLDYPKRHENMILYKRYSPEEYPKYDNYDAININKVSEIPCDYYGVMGVPITFLDKYCPEQFEIVGVDSPYYVEALGIKAIGEEWVENYKAAGGTGHITANMHSLCLYENGIAKTVYKRVLIRRKS